MKRRRMRPPKAGKAYRKVWRIVEGAIADAIIHHPEYFAQNGARKAQNSIAKRVTGAILGFAEQSVKGRRGSPAASTDRALARIDASAQPRVESARSERRSNATLPGAAANLRSPRHLTRVPAAASPQPGAE